MKRFLLLSHGKFAKGMQDTLTIFLGDDHKFDAISAYVDNVDPVIEIENYFKQVTDEDQVIIFTDILGGSVNQLVLPYLQREHTFIITGFNLPVLLELAFFDGYISLDEIRTVVENGKETIVLMNDYQFDQFQGEDE